MPATFVRPMYNTSDVSVTKTRPNNDTLYTTLDVCGTDAATNMEFVTTLPAGSKVRITEVSLRIDVAAIPAGMGIFRLHLYNAAPTAITDNLAFNLPAADRAKYLGYITIPAPLDLGDTLFAQDLAVNKEFTLASDSSTFYGQLQVVDAFQPSALTVKTVGVKVVAI
jgi:hypothetical protein